jgi:DhnA family fructose-bisphosphate aldolase class Ia
VEVAAGAPVFIAGGPRTDSDRETVQLVADLLAGGARGVMFGRTLFQSPEPLALMNTVRAMIHEDLPLEKALQRLAPNGKDNQARSAKKKGR